MNRRQFMASSGSCSAHVFGLAAFSPCLMKHVFANEDDQRVIATEKWGRLEKVQDGVWALISTPFDTQDFTTVCNGESLPALSVARSSKPKGATVLDPGNRKSEWLVSSRNVVQRSYAAWYKGLKGPTEGTN